MSNIAQLQELAAVAQSFNSSDEMENLVNAISQQVSAGAAAKLGDAIQSIRDAGEDPSDYIPRSRSAIRAKQAEARMAQQDAAHEQQLRHAEELHQLRIRKEAAEIALAEKHVAAIG